MIWVARHPTYIGIVVGETEEQVWDTLIEMQMILHDQTVTREDIAAAGWIVTQEGGTVH